MDGVYNVGELLPNNATATAKSHPSTSEGWGCRSHSAMIEMNGSLVVVTVTVAPVPVFLLFFGRQLAKIAMGIAVVFAGPLVVVNNFAVVPLVVVAVVGVIDPVVMVFGASCAQDGRRQRRGEKE
jgi:hypothetical protein